MWLSRVRCGVLERVAALVGAARETALINLGTRFGTQVLEDARLLLLSETSEIDRHNDHTCLLYTSDAADE